MVQQMVKIYKNINILDKTSLINLVVGVSGAMGNVYMPNKMVFRFVRRHRPREWDFHISIIKFWMLKVFSKGFYCSRNSRWFQNLFHLKSTYYAKSRSARKDVCIQNCKTSVFEQSLNSVASGHLRFGFSLKYK